MDSGKYSALTIANYIIKLTNYQIDNYKLQKILYLIQHYYQQDNITIFKSDYTLTGFGPVYSNVYAEYKFYGDLWINLIKNETNEIIADKDKSVIKSVVDKYIKYSNLQLFQMINQKNY